MRFLCYYDTDLYYTFLPVIRPTEYMYKKYGHLGNEKWEIYAEVVRKIYCEVGGFTESDLGYRDSHFYGESLIKGEYDYEQMHKKND